MSDEEKSQPPLDDQHGREPVNEGVHSPTFAAVAKMSRERVALKAWSDRWSPQDSSGIKEGRYSRSALQVLANGSA